MFLARVTVRQPMVLVAALGVAVLVGALSVPPASAATTGPQTSPAAAPPIGPVADHGSANAPGQVSVTLQLTAAQPAALAALAGATVHTRQARRAALLAAAPSTDTASAVASFLTRSGLTITARNAFSLTASGPRTRISSLFPAAKAASAVRSRTAANATSSPLVIPAELTGLASSIVGGTDTRRVAYPRYVRAARAVTPSFKAAPITGATARSLYSVPAAATTSSGMGITVATIQFSGWDSSNLTTFATQQHLPDPVASGQYQAVSVDGASPTTPDGTGGDLEVALDQEALLTTAPKANQVAYVAPNTTKGFVDAFNAVAADALANRGGHLYTALSVSWGQCEAAWLAEPGSINAMHTAIQNVVAAGVTVFAASGDAGAFDCSTQTAPNDALAVDYPASDTNVIAVGGLTTDPVAKRETTWWRPSGSARPGYLGDGGGGGLSSFWPGPAWQTGRQPGSTARLVPDISLDADPYSGLSIVAPGHPGNVLVGGTSLAAPLAAATLTDLQIADGAASTYGLGNILPALYRAPSNSFRDTTVGTNGYYSARPGYDLATGLGAPLWSRLDNSLIGLRLSALASSGSFTIPVQVSQPAGVVYKGYRSGVGTDSEPTGCDATGALPTPPTSVMAAAYGPTVVWVEGYRPNGSCYRATAPVTVVPVGTSSKFSTVGPCRVFDTRTGLGSCPGATAVAKEPLGPGKTMRVNVLAMSGIPADATAVVLNITAVGATAGTYVTAWPDGTTRPSASNLNPARGKDPSPNLAVVPIGANGYIDLYNFAGSVNLVADISGYFAPDGGDTYATTGPCRVFDTRTGLGTCPGATTVPRAALGPGKTLRVNVLAMSGIPADATAVVLNLTAVGATTHSYVTAWADGTAKPTSSNLNPAPNTISTNLAVVPIGANGYIDLYNFTGSVNLVADVAGYFATGTGAMYATTGPCRVFDTRYGSGTCAGATAVAKVPLGAGKTLRMKVSGVAGIPANATAAVLNLTAVGATTGTYLTAWADGKTRPAVSNLNPAQNQGPTPSLAVVPIGSNGYIDIYNAVGSVNLVADVAGYFAPS
jgi:hypothetical protein